MPVRPSRLPSHRPDPPFDVTLVSGEDGTQVCRTEVTHQHFREEISKIGRDSQVPPVFAPLGGKRRPISVHLAAVGVSAQHQHRGCAAMVGASGTVLLLFCWSLRTLYWHDCRQHNFSSRSRKLDSSVFLVQTTRLCICRLTEYFEKKCMHGAK